MYDEILKIIEGGMKNDQQKVINYSKKLIVYFENENKKSIANKINKIIIENNTRMSSLDSLSTKPLDRESKLEMVDISVPYESNESLIFNSLIENEVRDFIMSYYKKDELIKLGIESNNHLLLYGPPGTGKTSIAKYISIQTNLPLITVRMDALISSLLGNTSKNIRKVFEYASRQPCILFLDEFDVIAKIRDDDSEIGELKRVVNSLIQNIDSFSNENILIAATNHSQLLDNAIWRRFDKAIMIRTPNEEIREKLIKEFSTVLPNNYIRDKKKIKKLVELTSGFSPSTIKTIINMAAKKSIVKEKKEISFAEVLFEIFCHLNSDGFSEEQLVVFLNKNEVTQKDIVSIFDFPIRKVRYILSSQKEE